MTWRISVLFRQDHPAVVEMLGKELAGDFAAEIVDDNVPLALERVFPVAGNELHALGAELGQGWLDLVDGLAAVCDGEHARSNTKTATYPRHGLSGEWPSLQNEAGGAFVTFYFTEEG